MDWLQQLRQEGRLESSGLFTLEPKRALALLRQNLLEEPNFYALCLISAAVAQGAARIQITYDASRFELWHDGPAYTQEQLNNLRGDLLYGLQAVWELGARVALIETRAFGQADGHRLTLNNTGVRCEPSQRLGEGNRIVVEFARHLFGGGARRGFDMPALLKRRCRWIQQSLTVNGREINEVPAPGACLAMRTLGRGPLYQPLGPASIHESEGEFSAALLLGAGEQLDVVVHGVTFQPPPLNLEFPVAGVVFSDQLSKDLSQRHIVENPEWERLREWLRKESRELVRQLYLDWDKLDGEQRQLAIPLLDKLAELESRAGNLPDAQKLFEKLLVARASQMEATEPDVLLTLSNLATLHSLQERHDLALPIFLAIAEDLQKVGRLAEAGTYYARAFSLETRVSSEMDDSILMALVGWIECCELHLQLQLSSIAHPRLEALRKRDPELALCLVERVHTAVRAQFPDAAGGEFLGGAGTRCTRCKSGRLMQKRVAWKVEGNPVRAQVCGACGHIELSIAEFARLWDEEVKDRKKLPEPLDPR